MRQDEQDGYINSEEDPLTRKIIACAFKVHGVLGFGFLEKVYQNSLAIELQNCGLIVSQHMPITVRYDDRPVGEYYADLLVEKKVICELKAVEMLTKAHEVQLVNYLKATGVETGLLINFGERVVVRRKFKQSKHPVNLVESC